VPAAALILSLSLLINEEEFDRNEKKIPRTYARRRRYARNVLVYKPRQVAGGEEWYGSAREDGV
jgi:hypothetical protein